MRRYYLQLVGIVILFGLIIWMNVPNHPSLSIGSFQRSMDTVLGLDLRGGVQVLLEADMPADQKIDPQSLNDAKQILENRTNALGVSENVFQVAGDRRIVGEFPGLTDPERIIKVIKETGLLEFVDLGTTRLAEGTVIKTDFGQSTAAEPATTATPAAGADPAATPDPTTKVWHTIMTGKDLKSVGVTTAPSGGYEITFSLNSEGAAIFKDHTANNVGKILAIVLDKKVISAPNINGPIPSGEGSISGSFTYDTANALAIQMRYGSLPIPFKVVESRVVGPTLGQDSLNKSLLAGGIGFLIVILFMALYYRLMGVIADVSIIFYALFSLVMFKLIPVTLTLPGIAGFLLSTGSALDANILFFERIKEELRGGRTFAQAIDLGWKRAWPSIRDSNIATLITCVILFWFGSSFGATIVKGFAFTLAVGVGVSLLCAYFVTRTFLTVLVDRLKPQEKDRKLFGLLD